MDHRPRPPRDRGNACAVTDRKSPLQVVDQSVDYVAFVFADAHQAPQALHLSGVATGFSDCDRPVVFVDPVADLKTALEQQLKEVFGLTVIGRHRRHWRVLTYVGRSRGVRGDRSRGFRRLGVRESSDAPIRVGSRVWVACAILGGRSGEDHFCLSQLDFGFGQETIKVGTG
jgi:hypothetical protein